MTDTHIKIKPVVPKVQYTGNGVTTDFPYTFAIFDETDMVVYLDDDIIESGYTITGAGETNGGNVIFDTAPDDGVKVTLLRNVPIERLTDFQEGGTFRPKNLNDEFDRQTAFVQQVQEKVDRTLILPPTTDINPSLVLEEVNRIYDSIDNVDAVADNETNVNAVADDLTNINTVAENIQDIKDAQTYAAQAKQWAVGQPTEPEGGSAKKWAEIAVENFSNINNSTISFTQGGVSKGSFTLNQDTNATIELDAGGGGAVDSVNGQTGTVVLDAEDVGALPDSTVIPTVNDPTITFTQGGVSKGTITLNQSSDQTIALDAGGGGGGSSGLTPPDFSTGVTLATSQLHTIPSDGWISSSGSVRVGANTGTQILGGGALGMVPVEANGAYYISGMAATFYACK